METNRNTTEERKNNSQPQGLDGSFRWKQELEPDISASDDNEFESYNYSDGKCVKTHPKDEMIILLKRVEENGIQSLPLGKTNSLN